MVRLLAVLILLAACDEEGTGPNSPYCVEKRMNWLELEHHRKQLTDPAVASKTALQQDLIVNANTQCFPGFVLR